MPANLIGHTYAPVKPRIRDSVHKYELEAFLSYLEIGTEVQPTLQDTVQLCEASTQVRGIDRVILMQEHNIRSN